MTYVDGLWWKREDTLGLVLKGSLGWWFIADSIHSMDSAMFYHPISGHDRWVDEKNHIDFSLPWEFLE